MSDLNLSQQVLSYFQKGNHGVLELKDEGVTNVVVKRGLVRLIQKKDRLTENQKKILVNYFEKNSIDEITKSLIEEGDYKYRAVNRFSKKSISDLEGKKPNIAVKVFALLINYPFESPIKPFRREDKTHFKLPSNFVGRKFLFDAVDTFIDKHESGYFYLMGNPGIGKSAFAIKYAFERSYFLHVINAQRNGGNTQKFNEDILEQLDKVYEFDAYFSKGKINLSNVLNRCSALASNPIVIVIDGIDELDDLTSYRNHNILGLPDVLPKGVFILSTMRNIDDDVRLPQNNGDIEKFRLEDNLPENVEDIKTYIQENTKDEKAREYITKNNTTRENLVKLLEDKSENNFMYLFHVIREIKEGVYTDVDMNELPKGLEGYYRDHWERMMQGVSEIDKEIKLKTIFVLGTISSPVSTKILTEILSLDLEKVKEYQVQTVINQWRQFFNISFSGDQKEYSIYHKSFLDFLASQDLVISVGYDLDKASSLFSDYLEGDMFKDIDLSLWD